MFVHYFLFFSFERHLIHLEILSDEFHTHYEKIKTLDVENDYGF